MTKVLTITVPDDLTLGLVMRVYDFMVDEHGIEASKIMFDDSTKGFKCFRICYESKNQEQITKFEEFVLDSIKHIKVIEKMDVHDEAFPLEIGKYYIPQSFDFDDVVE